MCTKKLKGLKKSVGDTKYKGRAYRTYLNIRTGEIWTNEYINYNSWTEYRDSDIEVGASKKYL